MSTTPLPLSTIASVTYTLSTILTPVQGFNLGLIVGTSPVVSAATRVAIYPNLAAMVAAGFSTSAPEYAAAQLYFSATSQPTQVAIGRQATGETLLQAVTACRAANANWYILMCTAASNTDIAAIAAYIEGCSPYSLYMCRSQDAAVLANTAGNIFATLAAANYSRTFMLYSTTPHATAAVMGYAMGQTSDLANSAYTLLGKSLPGVTAELLTTQQVLNIELNNGNVFINRGGLASILEKGSMANAGWFDEVIYLDKLASAIQFNVANLIFSVPKVPQTESGMGLLRTIIGQACASLKRAGFIAPGNWTGQPVLALNTGDYLSNGFYVQSDAISTQSAANRASRKAPNIYVAVKLSGAIQSVVIQIQVNR